MLYTPMKGLKIMYHAYPPYPLFYPVYYPSNLSDYMTSANHASMNYRGQMKPAISLKDYGPEPYVVNMEEATQQNNTFRTALWTGEYLQLTLMSIDIGDDIGLEIHNDHDQFIRVEAGNGLVQMGNSKDRLDYQEEIYNDYAVFIPAGKWHNLINTGSTPLKLYSIYAPPEHPRGTIHTTKEEAEKHYH